LRIAIFILFIYLVGLTMFLVNREIILEKERIKAENKHTFFISIKEKLALLKISLNDGMIEELYVISSEYGLNVDLFLSQGLIESRFNQNAIGMSGERGIFQFMESTARDTANKIGINYVPGMEFNPYISLQLYAYHIGELLGKYNGDIQLALLGYNCGTGCIDYYLSLGYSIERMKKSIYGNKKPYDDKVGEICALLTQIS
jgi:soluble lytic murein transglycosylase-like protein